ncbi:hypothetical protein [Streptomyces sp. NPDC024089]|uniref:hypothetical protein n=1 Tax=Streptomyces sp. NPDC024089 TaxID=3154328 RepID=UPI003400C522
MGAEQVHQVLPRRLTEHNTGPWLPVSPGVVAPPNLDRSAEYERRGWDGAVEASRSERS